MKIWVDADACPVKDEIERLALRRRVPVVHVCAHESMTRTGEGVEVVLVPGGPDAADEWILAHCSAGDILVTYDVPLSSSAIRLGVAVIEFRGRELHEDNIPLRAQVRDLVTALREEGGNHGGPRPFNAQDRRAFTASLGRVLDRLLAPPKARGIAS